MKKQTRNTAKASERMRPEYDFSRGVRGKHVARYASGSNVIVLEPDVAKHFPTADDVNETLRVRAKLMRRKKSRTSQST